MNLTKKQTSETSLPRRVIVVEDDAVLGLSIEQALLDSGVGEVTVCSSAACTMEVLKDNHPDAIILDVHLADSDDGWAIAELLDTLGGKPPRIVFQTGAPESIPERVAELGQVLTKPYTPEDLIDLLRAPEKKGLLTRLRGR